MSDIPKKCKLISSGTRYGRLVVLSFERHKRGYSAWKCKCDCGNITHCKYGPLTKGKIKSCGCFRRDMLKLQWNRMRSGEAKIYLSQKLVESEILRRKTESRECRRCKQIRLPIEYDSHLSMICKECYYLARLQRTMGISPNEYRALWEKQDRCCAICKSKSNRSGKKPKRFCVDHDHANGRIRGIVCFSCNGMLGYAQDNAGWLQSAIWYLYAAEDKTFRTPAASVRTGTLKIAVA